MSQTPRGAASNYPTMSVQAICDLYQPSKIEMRGRIVSGKRGFLAGHEIADVAFLFLWATGPLLLEGIPQRVALSWGFTPKQIVPWVKGRIAIDDEAYGASDANPANVTASLVLQKGLGRITRGVTEFLLVCARGKYSHLIKDKGQNGLIVAEEDSVILAPRSTHSTKPDAQYALIEKICPGPYLELFARKTRPAWTSWGNEFSRNGDGVTVMTDFDGAQIGFANDPLKDRPGVHLDTSDPYADLRR